MNAVISVSQDSRLELHELVVRREDGQVIVGRVDTAEFVALPEIGGRALELLAAHPSVGEAEAVLSVECETSVDLVEFADQLIELGYVRRVDGAPIGGGEVFRPSFPWLRPHHCRWIFRVPARTGFAILVTAAVVTVATNNGLVPSYQDFFWSTHTSVVLAVNTLMLMLAIGMHEIGHLIAARSVGDHGRFSLGTRLHLLVAQTDVTGLWAFPRRLRYRAYLAGIGWDLILASVLILAMAHLPLPEAIRALASAMVLLLALGLAGQLQLFLRTDLYFVLADTLRAKNLMEDAAAYVVSRLRHAAWRFRHPRQRRPRLDVLHFLPAGERRRVRFYARFMVLGCTAAVLLYALYGLPILIELYMRGFEAVEAGMRDRDLAQLADGLLTLGVQGAVQGLFLWVLIRNRAARVRAVLARTKSAPAVIS